jgi:serine/threonine-protein kinase
MSVRDKKTGAGEVLILSGSMVLANGTGASAGPAPARRLEERILLALIDGRRPISEITRLSGLPAAAAREHLRGLFERGVVVEADAATGGPIAAPAGAPVAPAAAPAAIVVRAGAAAAARGLAQAARAVDWQRGEVLAGSELTPTFAGTAIERRGQPFRVGSYEVAMRIGQGGMGSIYVCRRVGPSGFQRLYVLKAVRQRSAQEGAALQSLINEGRIGSLLSHPNLQAVVDMGMYKDQPFLILDYVEGATLADLTAEGKARLPPAVAVSILLDLLRGLQAAHDTADAQGRPLGLVHGDVSPPNILVGTDGTTRLGDFGSVRLTGQPTPAGTPVPGKPSYMAPEQVAGEPVDVRTDVFAAGIVMWRALTGQELFAAATHEETAMNVLKRPILPPSIYGAPACLDEVCLRALSRPAAGRFATAEEMASLLLKIAVANDLVAPPRLVGQLVRREHGDTLAERRRRAQAIFAGMAAGGITPPPRLGREETPPPLRVRPNETLQIPAAAVPYGAIAALSAAVPAVPEPPAGTAPARAVPAEITTAGEARAVQTAAAPAAPRETAVAGEPPAATAPPHGAPADAPAAGETSTETAAAGETSTETAAAGETSTETARRPVTDPGFDAETEKVSRVGLGTRHLPLAVVAAIVAAAAAFAGVRFMRRSHAAPAAAASAPAARAESPRAEPPIGRPGSPPAKAPPPP